MRKPLTFLVYIGGKRYMLKHILDLLDYSKTCYIELFGGSAKVLLNKPPHKVEIYNDCWYDIYNLFKIVSQQETYDKLLEIINNYVYCEQLFYDWWHAEPRDDIERAAKTYITINSSFNGNMTGFGYSFLRNEAVKFWSKVDMLREVRERLKNVTILNRDYKKVLEMIKNESDIMLYADPPYFGCEDYYKATFTKEDHYILAEYLNKAQYSVLLSYYEFPGIYDLYPKGKWRYYYFEKAKHSCYNPWGDDVRRPRAVELLIANYDTKMDTDRKQLVLFED